MSTFLSEREHTARKRHCCDECTTMIAVGQRYSAQVSVDGGDFNVWKGHVECRAAAMAYRKYANLHYDDETYGLCNDIDNREDAEWLLSDHPIVAERLGIKPKVAA